MDTISAGLFRKSRGMVFLGLLLSLAWPFGCSSGQNTARVSGKVTSEGKAVAVGTIMFVPIVTVDAKNPGKAATGLVQSDGSYSLNTYSRGDGAMIGRHRVTFSPPPASLPEGKTLSEPGQEMPKAPFQGFLPQPKEVEVKPGSNTINIDLVPPPPAPSGK